MNSPILKPDFHLSLAQLECLRQLGFSFDGDVFAEQKLLLQFDALIVRVDHPVLISRSRFAYKARESC